MRADHTSTVVPAPPATDRGSSDQNAAVAAGFLGWTLDAFDYFLLVYCLTTIGREFGRSDLEMASSITLTLALRPVGALLFGTLADRYGRRIPLMLNLTFSGIAEFATAFAPNFTTFLILRALFGIGMGGEWGTGASLTMEKVPARLRGFFGGLIMQGYSAGNILAAVSYSALIGSWGWRPLFMLGGAPALLALFVRLRVKESEVWKETKAQGWSELWVSIRSKWKLFCYIVILMTFMGMTSHGTLDMYPTFMQRYWHYDSSRRAMISAVAAMGAICGGITFAWFSDSRGRRRTIIAGLLLGTAVTPLWAFAPNAALLVTGAILIQFMIQGAWGVIPAHLAELSPDGIRGIMSGFAYQCGVLLSGSIVMVQALLAQHISYPATMAITAAGVFLGSSVVVLAGKERRGRAFGAGI